MEIYQALKNDHEEIKDILNDLVALKDDDDYRFVLIDQLKDLLIPHARAEESVFYNTLRAINADKRLAMHGYAEHMAAETLLRSLQVMDKMNLSWKGTAEKLRDALLHHIEEEETEIFEDARLALTPQEAEAIGDAFLTMKPEIQKEGFMKTTMDMVINLMPPRFADKVKSLGSDSSRT